MIGYMVGNYKVVEKIGEGGMGAVFKGIDLMLSREVAIKMLRPELASQPQVVERFRTEAITLARLNHPYIAMLYNFVQQGNDLFMVMEYVRGWTIEAIIRTHGPMPIDRALPMFSQALEGIDQAHRLGIIHRDIKPANIMLTESGSIKVMDFGIARVVGSTRFTRQGNVIGTIEYMSPEAVRGLDVDARSDVYSLGLMLYEMLTGRLPFNAVSEFEMMKAQVEQAPIPPRTFVPAIPIEIERAIMRSLAKKPEARIQTINEFRTMLLARGTGTFPQGQININAAANAQPNRPSPQVFIETQPAPDAEAFKDTQLTPSTHEVTLTAYTQPAYQPQTDIPGQGATEALPPVTQSHWSTPSHQIPAHNTSSSSLLHRLTPKQVVAAGVAGITALSLVALPFVLKNSNDQTLSPSVSGAPPSGFTIKPLPQPDPPPPPANGGSGANPFDPAPAPAAGGNPAPDQARAPARRGGKRESPGSDSARGSGGDSSGGSSGGSGGQSPSRPSRPDSTPSSGKRADDTRGKNGPSPNKKEVIKRAVGAGVVVGVGVVKGIIGRKKKKPNQ